MTDELLEPGISTQHQGVNAHFFPTGRRRTKGVVLEQRVRAWRIGRPIYEEKVTIKGGVARAAQRPARAV